MKKQLFEQTFCHLIFPVQCKASWLSTRCGKVRVQSQHRRSSSPVTVPVEANRHAHSGHNLSVHKDRQPDVAGRIGKKMADRTLTSVSVSVSVSVSLSLSLSLSWNIHFLFKFSSWSFSAPTKIEFKNWQPDQTKKTQRPEFTVHFLCSSIGGACCSPAAEPPRKQICRRRL